MLRWSVTTTRGAGCCKNVKEDAVARSPFGKLLILDWYDGPARGIMICDGCGLSYHFVMLDWNKRHNVRLFGLCALPPRALDDILAFFGEVPDWPIWMPSTLRNPSDEVRSALDAFVKPILANAGPPWLVVSWEDCKTVSARRVPGSLAARFADWFALDTVDGIFDWFRLLHISKG